MPLILSISSFCSLASASILASCAAAISLSCSDALPPELLPDLHEPPALLGDDALLGALQGLLEGGP
eukprot:CAMPEP_0182486310 /NCGR_PEP_ID=MMETSP1319-20130603/46815_1 /TAXON_ID=172717 /ORGANISM="Bolidomonas pacifica, Strain RCC208" /LENGTH=66 /DNA_ID=CAMNT_0024688385 /DNA_START=21 /DNA_END=216 /DNA_ORIENTATION=+